MKLTTNYSRGAAAFQHMLKGTKSTSWSTSRSALKAMRAVQEELTPVERLIAHKWEDHLEARKALLEAMKDEKDAAARELTELELRKIDTAESDEQEEMRTAPVEIELPKSQLECLKEVTEGALKAIFEDKKPKEEVGTRTRIYLDEFLDDLETALEAE